MDKTSTPAPTVGDATDAGRIRLGGAYRHPATRGTADNRRIRLGGAYRLPAAR